MDDWGESKMPNLAGKRALVTGAASGIGYEAARALALAGAQVLMVDRDEVGGAAAVKRIRYLRAGAKVDFKVLDLGNLRSIEHFSDQLLAQRHPLNILFNNAGIHPLSTRRTTVDGFELTFGIGHLGHFALTGRLLPLLLATPSARIVTTSSLVHKQGWFDRSDLQIERNYEAQRAYSQTKLANLMFARELQRRANQAGVTLTSVAAHPGVARTNIGANRNRQGTLRWKDRLVNLALSVVMPLLGQDAQQGTLPLLYGATVAPIDPGGFYGPRGFGEMKGSPAPAKIAASALAAEMSTWLWETSVLLTGVDFEQLTPNMQKLPAPEAG